MAERSKALRSGRSLSGGVGSNPTSDKTFSLRDKMARLSAASVARCLPSATAALHKSVQREHGADADNG